MINEFLNWNIHITDICKRLAKNIGLLFKLKYLLPKNVLFMIYNSLVLPYLNYCNNIWGNTYKSHLSKMYILQKKAVRIITNSHVQSPSAPLFKELQILSIYDLITLNTLIFMYSINANILPDKFSNMFVSNSNIHNYFTRQRHHYHQPNLRSTSGLNSLIYNGVKKWNNLPYCIKSSSTLTRFRKLCKNLLLKSHDEC